MIFTFGELLFLVILAAGLVLALNPLRRWVERLITKGLSSGAGTDNVIDVKWTTVKNPGPKDKH